MADEILYYNGIDMQEACKIINLPNGVADNDAVNLGQVNTLINNAVASAVLYKGVFDASATDFSALADASQGDLYKVSVAGTIDGRLFSVNDTIIVNKDVTGTPVTADIDLIDNTEAADLLRISSGAIQNGGSAIAIDADKNTVSNLVVASFKTSAIEDSTDTLTDTDTALPTSAAVVDYVALRQAAKRFAADITGDGTTSDFTITHNLGSVNFVASVRNASGVFVSVSTKSVDANNTLFTFSKKPALDEVFKVYIIA